MKHNHNNSFNHETTQHNNLNHKTPSDKRNPNHSQRYPQASPTRDKHASCPQSNKSFLASLCPKQHHASETADGQYEKQKPFRIRLISLALPYSRFMYSSRSLNSRAFLFSPHSLIIEVARVFQPRTRKHHTLHTQHGIFTNQVQHDGWRTYTFALSVSPTAGRKARFGSRFFETRLTKCSAGSDERQSTSARCSD